MLPTPEPDEIASPCIGVCQVNGQRICVGCHRSLGEIAEWSSASNQRKLRIVENTQRRRQACSGDDREGI